MVIQFIRNACLSEAICKILNNIERVHKIKNYVFAWLKDLLVQNISILTIVEHYLAISSAYHPFIVGFLKRETKCEQRRIRVKQRVNSDIKRTPFINEEQ